MSMYDLFNRVVDYQGAAYIVVSVIPASCRASRLDTLGLIPIRDYWVSDGSTVISVLPAEAQLSTTPFPPQPGLGRLLEVDLT